MAILSSKEYRFTKVKVNGNSLPVDSLLEIITPELEDPYWEFIYSDPGNENYSIFATGNITIEAIPKMANLELVEKTEGSVRRLKRKEDTVNET